MAFKYDQSIIGTEEGRRIYEKWRYARVAGVCDEWRDFNCFYRWVMESGYEHGKILARIDVKKPFGPDNCRWAEKGDKGEASISTEKLIKKWNKTVNRIRVAYGMEPFEV